MCDESIAIMFYAVFAVMFLAQAINIGQDVYHRYYAHDYYKVKQFKECKCKGNKK